MKQSELLRRLRFDHEISQVSLAKELDIKTQQLSNIESGNTGIPPKYIKKLCKVFNVKQEVFMEAYIKDCVSKWLSLLMVLLVVSACGKSSDSASGSAMVPFPLCDQLSKGETVNGIGDFVECNSNYGWFKVGNNYFGLDGLGNIRESNALIYSDDTCDTLVGEEHSYPLKDYSGDYYTFSFRGVMYYYDISIWAGNYEAHSDTYTMDKLGNCTYKGVANNVALLGVYSGSIQMSYDLPN